MLASHGDQACRTARLTTKVTRSEPLYGVSSEAPPCDRRADSSFGGGLAAEAAHDALGRGVGGHLGDAFLLLDGAEDGLAAESLKPTQASA